ncbi:MAG: glycosyl hydrolase family 18 protein [Cellulosilyticaceae bacterium]
MFRKTKKKWVAYLAAMMMLASSWGTMATYAAPLTDVMVAAEAYAATSAPGKPNLSHDNYGGVGTFNVEATLWSNATATKAVLYENGVAIYEKALTPAANGSQTVKVQVSPTYNGTYEYYMVYSNEAGATQSNTITVKVTTGKLPPAPPRTEPNTNGKKIVMYYPEWGIYGGHNSWMPKDIPWESITHMNYAFFTIGGPSKTLEPGKPGEVIIFDSWAATGADAGTGEPFGSEYKGTLGAMRKAKREYSHVRMMMSVGGWSQSANFVEAAATATGRQTFADSAIALMRQYEFDGIDLDWEYPTFSREPDINDNPNDQGNPRASAADKENFTLLLRDLRAALDKAGQEDGVHYELTVAVGAGIDKMEQTEVSKYHQYVDFINLMTYDFHGAWEPITGHQSQLYGRTDEYNPYDEVVTQYNVDQAVKNFQGQGVPNNKLVVGVPYYTRGWKNVEPVEVVPGLPGLYAPVKPDAFGYYGAKGIFDGGVPAGNNPYYHIVEVLEKDPAFKKYWDPYAQVPYLYSESKKEFYTYDDPQSIAVKTDYINTNNLGGAIIWEATCERVGNPVLTDQIFNAFSKGSSGMPAAGSISVDKASVGVKENYTVTVNVPANSKATSYELLENNQTIKTGAVTAAAEKLTFPIQKEKAGKFTYQVVLKNNSGSKVSNTVAVEIKDVVAKPLAAVVSATAVKDGAYTVTATIPAQSAGESYKLYEGATVIKQGVVDPKAVAVTTITQEFTKKPVGSYVYKMEITNQAGSAMSNEVVVVVEPAVSGKPKVPTLTATAVKDGAYDVTGTIPAKSEATAYTLYENNVAVKTGVVTPDAANVTTVTNAVKNKQPGTYTYKLEVTNTVGTSVSNEVVVVVETNVPQEKPKAATLTATAVKDAAYDVVGSVPAQSGATSYKLYEGSAVIKQGTVDAQMASTITQAFTNKAEGTYAYQLEMINAVGSTMSNTVTVTVEKVVDPGVKPGAFQISTNRWNGEASYDVNFNMYWGENGTSWNLYENGVLVHTAALSGKSPNAQSGSVTLSQTANGTYKYVAELVNAAGKTTSNELVINVTQANAGGGGTPTPTAKPSAPAAAHNNWNNLPNYQISFNMWWGENGTSWKLYENGMLVHEESLTANGQSAQMGTYNVQNKAPGTYTYYVELINAAGATSSNEVTVTVN